MAENLFFVRMREFIERLEDRIFSITPIGAADYELKERIDEEKLDFEDYEEALDSYRFAQAAFNISRVLLYAGLISSIASTFNIYGLGIIEQIASYIGATVTFVLYTVTRHFASRRKELYRLERELLLNQV
jgi:hypothetical protein